MGCEEKYKADTFDERLNSLEEKMDMFAQNAKIGILEKGMKNGEIMIMPFSQNNVRGLGYNLTPTLFCYSIRKKRLLRIHYSGGSAYIYIPKNDTVLFYSRECIYVSKAYKGAFYSRVRIVSEGLGHVSTTLDPGWSGPGVFSINNPMGKRVKFYLYQDTFGKQTYNCIVTLELTQAVGKSDYQHDNPPYRLDVLKNVTYKHISCFKRKRTQRLDELIRQLEQNNLYIDEIFKETLEENEKDQLNKFKYDGDIELYKEYYSQMFERNKYKINLRYEEKAREYLNTINQFVKTYQDSLSIRLRILDWIYDNAIVFSVVSVSLILMFIILGVAYPDFILFKWIEKNFIMFTNYIKNMSGPIATLTVGFLSIFITAIIAIFNNKKK